VSDPAAAGAATAGDARIASQARILRRLFLTLFLRGRGARGLRRGTAPKSIAQKLWVTLALYALTGCLALLFRRQSVFALGVYLHAMTFMFLGMFVASSAGEVLFNQEEGDILLHRPVQPRTLLWAKVRVLVEVSLWVAGAFNLVGCLAGAMGRGGSWLFPLAHALSTTLEAVFCTSSVVLVYQLCLGWFGRERLEGLMTTTQVLFTIVTVMAAQLVPRLVMHPHAISGVGIGAGWIVLLPPAWFAGLDDALAGTGAPSSWLLGLVAVAASAAVLWSAFGRLALTYESGLRALNERGSGRGRPRGRRRRLDRLVSAPPLCWWFRDPVTRASFVLTSAYLFRDRDTKLRLYPGISPMLIMPFVVLFQGGTRGGFRHGGFSTAFASGYLGLIPLFSMSLLQYSQHWQAADVFRAAPLAGPAAICRGARRAVLCFLTFPVLLLFGLVIGWFMRGTPDWVLLLPGVVTMPVYALIPNLGGRAVPFSSPIEGAKSVGRGLRMFGVMMVAVVLSGLAGWARHLGWFWPFLLAECFGVLVACAVMTRSIGAEVWASLE